MALGSGHKIPEKTTNSFIFSFLFLGFLISVAIWLLKRQSKNNSA
jgi:cbb3-type cytochrome oxidase subunit 3